MLDDVQTEPAYARIAKLGTRLSDGIDAMISGQGLPWRAFRYGPRSGFCLTPDLPRSVVEASASIQRPFTAARRVFMANRGIWDAIWSAGPQVGFAHVDADIDRYLSVASDFLDQVTLSPFQSSSAQHVSLSTIGPYRTCALKTVYPAS